MRTRPNKLRPLTSSLSRFKSLIGIAAALGFATQEHASGAPILWEGATGGTPGDGFLWVDPLNWGGDLVPAVVDDPVFGSGPAGLIQLGANQTVNSLSFNADFTLGAYGTNQVLTNTSGNVSVTSGDFATMNASYGGLNGINLVGGGSLFMNHPLPLFGGNITVDGLGTTLVHRGEGPAPQYNGVGSAQEFGRFDSLSLGFTPTVRNITLTNGGEYKIIGAGNNAEGGHKNIVIGAGGGTLNLAPGYLLQNLDDLNQIGVTTEAFTLAGKGRLIIGGTGTSGLAQANPFQGVVNINGGMLSLDAQLSQAVGANTYVRFLGIAGVGTTLNINNGGALMINNTTAATLDTPRINANNGSIIAFQGQDHAIGFASATAAGPTVLNISGTSTLLTRDLFAPQTQRFPRLRAELDGTGTLEIRGNTNSGGTPRLVIERSTPGSDFSGTFRLVENTSLEANPRFNQGVANGGTGGTVDTGKVLAGGDIEFAGWGGTLDVRDSVAGTLVLDYTNNEISITTAQAGAVNTIANIRGATAAGTGHLFNYGTLTMGDHRLAISGNNNYQTGFADTASIRGNAALVMNADNSHAVFSNASAIMEDAAGRSLAIVKAGQGNTAARDVIVGGGISLSNLDVKFGTLQLRGAGGAIGSAFGGAAPAVTINGGSVAGSTNANPVGGLLHLDNNSGHVVGTTTVTAAGNNNNRIVDSATLTMRGNGTLRLTSAANTGTTETIGTVNIFGHNSVDVVKTGTAPTPVAVTLGTVTLGNNATANFTGTNLGLAGNDTTRIIIPGTAAGHMGARYHSGNEWAKYDSTVDSTFELGATPFVAADYTIGTTEDTWALGQQIKQNGGTLPALTANRSADRFNFQTTVANQALNLAGFVLTADQGGIISSANSIGFKDGATAAAPSGTAGVTAGTTSAAASLFVHANSTIEFHAPIVNNLAGGAVTFVKSGTGTVILSHQDRGIGAAQLTTGGPFTTPTWSSTHTGGWVINDGVLNVHRGQFLGATPTTVTLNGGQLEINQPVSTSNADSILAGWGHNIVVNGNATVGADDNGESNDATTGDRALVPMGSLTINNGSTLAVGAFSDIDVAYMGGTTINGRATFNLVRNATNANTILNGVVSGSGFDVVGLNAAAGTIVLGGTQTDTAANTYDGTVTLYAGTLRMNKANGTAAITDGAAAEDVIINGGALLWGPGQHGDLSTTNNVNTTNNGLVGIAATSPAVIKNAGMNQIADTATITLLTGTLGESDRITNEKFGSLIMKNGTFNVGLGTVEIDTAIFSGGALGFDRGGTLKIGQATYLPGSFDQSAFTGLPTPGAYTTLEIGAGGVSLSGQNITLGNGFSGNVAGSGGRLRLGGNLIFNGSDLIGGSYGRKGIFVQNGSSFRELGGSHVDLMGGTRDFSIGTDSIYTITAPITNGGISKSGGGSLVLEPYQPSSFAGSITVNDGVLSARGDGAFGTSAGGVTINSGGTVKLDSSWSYGDAFTISGPGAIVPGDENVRELGALVSETGTNRLTGGVILAGNATIASNTVLDVSVTPGSGGAAYRISNLKIEGAGGITGSGDLTLSGHGDGVVLNGVNTTSGGLIKDGAGRWTIGGTSSLAGAVTITAGNLQVTNGGALGATAAGTTVLGGSLEIAGGISLAEPLSLHGSGSSVQSGALVGVSGTNSVSGPVTLNGPVTLRSNGGSLALTGNVTGADGTLTLSGTGNGRIDGAISVGAPGLAGLVKNGSGTWTLAGANTLLGTTTVEAGTLALDFTTQNSSKLNAGELLILSGGSVSIISNPTAGSSQFVSGLDIVAGGGSINVGGGTTGSVLSVGPINRAPGGTVNFNIGSNGAVVTSTGSVNGILGGYATVGNTDWATTSGSEVVPFTAYAPLNTAGGVDDQNSRISTGGRLETGLITNSLKIDGGVGVALDVNNLTLTSGGVLFTGTRPAAISGTGVISGATSGDELIVHTSGSTLEIAAPIIGAGSGSLTKTGPGTLLLTGASAYTGSINVNGGTLVIPGAPGFPGTLGSSVPAGNRLINLNGGAFGIMGDWDINDWDAGAGGVQSPQFNIGPAGGTLKSLYGAQFIINDGSATAGVATQLMGSGDLTLTGGGRYNFSGGTPQFQGFTGNVTVDGGILMTGHSNSLGGRQEQTVTLKAGSAIINSANFGLGQNGLPNNIVSEGGVEFFAQGGNRAYGGNIQLSGTNTIALFERDTLAQERQVFFNGRVSGTGVTLNVYGANFGNPFYLASGSNDLTGTINLNSNAVLETRMPGSLGMNAGDVTVNLQGANSRLFLRHFQNGDYHADVNVSNTSEINSDRLVSYAGGASQFLSINNLTASTNGILTFGGGNAYTTRVAGTATLTGNTVLNATGNVLFENGINFSGGADTLHKRGGGSVILHGPANHTGPTIVQQGFLIVQDGGTLANTSGIELRGGELRVENSVVTNDNRLNDAASITLGGGVLRLTGTEAIGTVTAVAGTTQIVNNPTSDTVPTPLTLTGFTRELGAVVQFQQADYGAATGAGTFGQARVSSRILIPGQANTTQTIPGFLGNNSLDFIQYDGTSLDNGVALGVRDMRNPGSGAAFPTNYSDNTAETGWNDGIILRRTNGTDTSVVTVTLTANRALDAMKIETGGTNRDITIDLSTFRLRIEGGGILDVAATTHDTNINGTTGALTAGPAVPGLETAELFLGGTSTLTNINAIVDNNGTQPVAVVKTGTGTISLNGNNTFTGGLFVTAGTINTTNPNGFGSTPGNITLAGGTLQFNIANASATPVDLGVPDHAITVRSNSLIVLDNGTGGTDHDVSLGGVTIAGPYTLGLRGFDSMDASFTGTHGFAGTPTLDMVQSGGNATSVFTFNGAITGSGFNVTSSGNVNDQTSVLQIGGGEAIPNTYAGKVTVLLPPINGEDLRVELNKAAGTVAITGDLEIQGGTVRNLAADQIADTSNLTITQGQYDANGLNETIASVTMSGGAFRTNPIGAVGTPVVTVSGDFNATGLDDTTGGADGVTVNSNSTLLIGGVLRLNGYSRAVLGATGANLVINGGLEITGNTLQQNSGTGANITRLNGDVTTFASSNVARLGNSTDSDTFTELNGVRTFTVADGSAGLDLALGSVVRNSTSPVAAGGIIKAGPGVMQIEGGGTSNSYTGGTTINSGSLILFKNTNVNAVPAGLVTIGDGTGGTRADQVILRNSHQIADAADVSIASSGVLDLDTFNASETFASLSGSGNVDLGPGSALTVDGSSNTTYAGDIVGAGSFVKGGSSVIEFTGNNDILGGTTINGTGGLIVNGVLGGSVTVNAGATLSGDGSILGSVTVNDGIVSPGNSPGSLDIGSFTMLTGTLLAEFNSTSSYDSLNVTGAVILGGNLSLTLGTGPFQNFDVFSLIINDGIDSVNGTFAGAPEGSLVGTSGGLEFYISYEGNVDGGAVPNDVILFVPEPGSAALLLGGLGSLLAVRRRRRNA